jgi:hypothetical protein
VQDAAYHRVVESQRLSMLAPLLKSLKGFQRFCRAGADLMSSRPVLDGLTALDRSVRHLHLDIDRFDRRTEARRKALQRALKDLDACDPEKFRAYKGGALPGMSNAGSGTGGGGGAGGAVGGAGPGGGGGGGAGGLKSTGIRDVDFKQKTSSATAKEGTDCRCSSLLLCLTLTR